jgi:hypothetical protein
MLMNEAITIDIVEARKWRAREAERLDKQEKKLDQIYTSSTLAWLNVKQENQDDELRRLLDRWQPGTCKWVFRHPKFISWKDDGCADRVLWINGIPGAGMCTQSVALPLDTNPSPQAKLFCVPTSSNNSGVNPNRRLRT